MLDSYGFNLWAAGYDKSVGASDDNDNYPFAGYKNLMNEIYNIIMKKRPVKILDIGIGTGVLSSMLYKEGNEITGIDFSHEMLSAAQKRMPNAELIQHDFSKGLPSDLKKCPFDFIISTYALHHLTDSEKLEFIPSLLNFINETGVIIIGDVSFQKREDLEKCRKDYGNDWDNDEFYFVFSELNNKLTSKCKLLYRQFSHCSGILEVYPLTRI